VGRHDAPLEFESGDHRRDLGDDVLPHPVLEELLDADGQSRNAGAITEFGRTYSWCAGRAGGRDGDHFVVEGPLRRGPNAAGAGFSRCTGSIACIPAFRGRWAYTCRELRSACSTICCRCATVRAPGSGAGIPPAFASPPRLAVTAFGRRRIRDPTQVARAWTVAAVTFADAGCAAKAFAVIIFFAASVSFYSRLGPVLTQVG